VPSWGRGSVAGFRQFRIRVSAYTSGSASVAINASYGSYPFPAPDVLNDGQTFADARNSVQILARTAGTGAASLSKVPITDSTGRLITAEAQDVSRTQVSLLIDNTAAVATEALIAYTGFNGATSLGTAATAAFTVPTGRVFRIQSVHLTARGTAIDTVRARVRGAATVAIGSQHFVSVAAAFGANAGASDDAEPTREIEIPAGYQVGLSVVGATTSTYTLAVMGYTYAP